MKRTIQWVLALGVLSLGGCSSVPSFDERGRPLEPICSAEGSPGPCPGGQLCLSGRCFERCLDDGECGARETCNDGVCEATGLGVDAGMFDAGNPGMPCDGACEEDEVCDIPTHDCVSCFDARQCSGATPICDYARGECVAVHLGEACRPCNDEMNCAEPMNCALRTGFTERVCLMPCSAASPECPPGFTCNALEMVCEPPLGGCTQLRRALDGAVCGNDIDCVARGAAVLPGTCNAPACSAACTLAAGCPEGWTCEGASDGAFCQAPATP